MWNRSFFTQLMLVGLAIVLWPEPARAASASLQIVPLAQLPAPAGATAELISPEPEQVLVIGRISSPSFAVERLDQIELRAPDGSAVPLSVDTSSVFEDFGEIVAVQILFAASRSGIETVEGSYTLHWGSDVQSPVTRLDGIALDSNAAEHYRSFQVLTGPAAAADSMNVTTIEVIADSNADYYALWYLLPIGLIFVLLTVRKLRPDERHA